MRRLALISLLPWSFACADSVAVGPSNIASRPAAAPVVEAWDRHGRPSFGRFTSEREGPPGFDERGAVTRTLLALADAQAPELRAAVRRGDFVVRTSHAVGEEGARLVEVVPTTGVPYHGGALRILLRADGVPLAFRGRLRPPAPENRDAAAGRSFEDAAGLEPGLETVRLDPTTIALVRDGLRVGTSARRALDTADGPRLVEVVETTERAERVVLDAETAEILARSSLLFRDTYTYRVYARPDGAPLDSPMGDLTPHPTGIPGATTPGYLASTLITVDGLPRALGVDPWLPTGRAKLDGQHAFAFVDWNDPDGLGASDLEVPTTATRTFDYATDPTTDPYVAARARAGAVHAFYVVNRLHDFFYDSGFDELAANAQRSNRGLGGLEGDPLYVEVQNAAAENERNNANMLALGDGSSPKMQLFLFDDGTQPTVEATPGGILDAGPAHFGPASYDVSAPAARADDGAGTTSDACEPLLGTYVGRIVVADRGGCTFERKVSNAQAAGAIGALIVNDQPGAGTVVMLGDPLIADPGIPSASTSFEHGATLVGALASGVTLRLARAPTTSRDVALDSAVVAHEWGHYLHLRHALCETTQCTALSEGWADFVALHMLVQPGDDLQGAYGMGAFAALTTVSDPAYFGVRRVPYSLDTAKNALTFRHVSDGVSLPSTHPIQPSPDPNSEVHNAGEIWASALFEAYGAVVAHEGGDVTRARRTMADAMVAAVRLAPDDATYVEARDALLAAAAALDPALAESMALAFARRGLGSCATAPARDSTDLGGVVESFAVAGELTIDAPTLESIAPGCDDDAFLDVGENATVAVVVRNEGPGTLTQVRVTFGADDAAWVFPAGSSVAVGSLGPYERRTVTVTASLASAPATTSVVLSADASATGGCNGSARSTTPMRVDVDALTAVAVRESFEPTDSPLTVEGDPSVFTHGLEVGNVRFRRASGPVVRTTASLVTPELSHVSGQPLTIAFRHRYDLEAESGGRPVDGVVIELSADGGMTYQDLSAYVAVPYTVLQVSATATSDLANRKVFGAQSAGYPSWVPVTLTVPSIRVPARFKLRFRFASDVGTASSPYDLDDLSFTGIAERPFDALVRDPGCGLAADASVFDADVAPLVDGGSLPPLRPIDDGCSCRAAGSSDPSRPVALATLALSSCFAIRRRAARGTRRP